MDSPSLANEDKKMEHMRFLGLVSAVCVGTAPLVVLSSEDGPAAPSAACVTYSASERPESLAEGRLTFAYENDAISKMKAVVGHGEDLVIAGDELNLAPNARIIAQGGGEVTVAAPVSASGDVSIGVGTLTYNDGLLPKDSWKTVFPNTILDEISIVSTDFSKTGLKGLGSGIGYPYHVKRGPGTMTVQLQIYAGYVKAVYLELKQDGADVVGRVTKAAYFNNLNYSYALGYDFFDNPRDLQNLSNGRTFKTYPVRTSDSLDAYGYGIAQLTAARRCEEYVHDGDFLSDQYDTLVATNARLEDIEVVYGLLGYNKRLRACNGRLWPEHVQREKDVLSVQLFNWVLTYTRCVKIEFRQRGDDVVARVIYAKYVEGDDFASYDFDAMGKNAGVVTKENYVETTYGYGIDYLLLRNRRGGAIGFSGACRWNGNLTVGKDEKVTFRDFDTMAFTPDVFGGGMIEFIPREGGAAVGAVLTLSGSAFGMSGGTYLFTGTPLAKLIAKTSNDYCLPKGRSIVGENAELHLNNGRWSTGVSEGRSELHVLKGGKLFQKAGNALHWDNQKVFLEGGELVLGHESTLTSYANHLTLTDGARVSGKEFLLGCFASDATVAVAGMGASTVDSVVTLLGKPDKTSYLGIAFDVGETGDDADLIQNGNITQHKDYPNGGLVKKGAGTLLLNGKITYTTAPTKLVEGELRLGASGVMTAAQNLEVSGGTVSLTDGTVNAMGDVTFAADSKIAFGKGAKLDFRSLTLAEGVKLAVVSDDRFGGFSVARRLTGEELARLTVNGCRAFQSATGKIREKRGSVIYLR